MLLRFPIDCWQNPCQRLQPTNPAKRLSLIPQVPPRFLQVPNGLAGSTANANRVGSTPSAELALPRVTGAVTSRILSSQPLDFI